MKNYLAIIVLFCLQKIKGERTTYSIYHILKGKKSSQTIQDAHLYNLSNVFHSFPNLSRGYFDEIIHQLKQNQTIQILESGKVNISPNGQILLNNEMEKWPVPQELDGWRFHSIQDIFWKRLSMLVQVSSNLVNFQSTYVPVHNDQITSDWIKSTLLKLGKSREILALDLMQELMQCFNKCNELKPEVIVWRLTGYKHIGLTPLQAAEMLNMDFGYFQIQFISSIHFMMNEIISYSESYPILNNLLIGYIKPISLTNSSHTTYKYLKLGYTIEEISSMRNLKLSTIEDHIVEIALNDEDFLLEKFITFETVREIRQAVKKLATKQLKIIRLELKEQVTYFQIRLVLAKYGDY